MADESNKDESHYDSKIDDPALDDLRGAFELFIDNTATAMRVISFLPNRPKESEDDKVRYDYWTEWTEKSMARTACDKLRTWSRQASLTHIEFWKYYLMKKSNEAGDGHQSILSRLGGLFKKSSRDPWTEIRDNFVKKHDLTVIASIPESPEKEKYNLCMRDDTHHMYNIFKHFVCVGETPSKKEMKTRSEFLGKSGKKFCDKPLEQITPSGLNDFASRLVDLLNTITGIDIVLSEELEKKWKGKYGAMNHRIEQVLKRLQELEWTEYEPPTDTLKAEIVEKIENNLLVCIHGDGGKGKTALAYDIIRDYCRGVAEYDLRGVKKAVKPFDAVIMLTTRQPEQGIFRTNNPRKGITTKQSKANDASFKIQIKNSFDEMIRVIIEAATEEGESFDGWADKEKQIDVALDILQEKRFLILIDNFEDVQRKKTDAEGKETEDFEQKEIMKPFIDFFKDFRKGGTTHNNSRFLITTRIDDGVGQENFDLPFLSMERAARLANKRYIHLYSKIREPYAVHEVVMRDIQSLGKENEDGDDKSIKSAFGDGFTQIWGHPLVIMLVVWRLAELGHQAMQNAERLTDGSTLNTVIEEISDGEEKGSQLFDSISDLSIWATSKSLGLLPAKWLLPFWTLVAIDLEITDKTLKKIFSQFNDGAAFGEEIEVFRRFLVGSTWTEEDRSGKMRFSRGSLSTLRFSLPKRLKDLPLEDKLSIDAIINEYKPEELGAEDTEDSQSISATEMIEEMTQYLKKRVIPREITVVEKVKIFANEVDRAAGIKLGGGKGKPFPSIQSGLPISKIQRKSLPSLINFCNTCIQVNWEDNDHAKVLAIIKGPIEELLLKIDDFIIQEWNNREIMAYGHEEKASILRWISSRLELNPQYRENITKMMKLWNANFYDHEENLAHQLVHLLIKSNQILPKLDKNALFWWCNNAERLHANGGLMNLEEIGPICVSNLTALLEAKEDLHRITDRKAFVNFFEELSEADVDLSKSQIKVLAKVLAAERDPWGITDPDFDVAAVRKGHSLILSFAEGELEEESWTGEIADRLITTMNMAENESNNLKFRAIITYRDVLKFEAVFDGWVEEKPNQNPESQSNDNSTENIFKTAGSEEMLGFIQKCAKEILVKHRDDFEDDENFEIDDMYLTMSKLGGMVRTKFENKWSSWLKNMDLNWKSCITQILEMKGFKACIEADEALKSKLKYRKLNRDEFHSVRLRDEESPTSSTRDSSPSLPPLKKNRVIPTVSIGMSDKLIEIIASYLLVLPQDLKDDYLQNFQNKSAEMELILRKLTELQKREEDERVGVDEGEEKTRAEIEMDLQIEAITAESLTLALSIISSKVGERANCEKKLLEDMKNIDGMFTKDMAARVIKQFASSQYSNTIGMRTRSAWIKHLRNSFQTKFLEHPDYENLLQIIDNCE
jgi:hypothetical protein